MIQNGSVEHILLNQRINHLERRLAQLEEQMPQASVESAEAPPEEVGTPETELRPADVIDRRSDAPALDDPDEGLEGARLVAIELLSSGYGRHEVAGYLRSTFGVADAEAVIAGAAAASG